MIFEQTKDMKLVKGILSTEGIWENIGGHRRDKEKYQPDESWFYLIGKVGSEAIGLFMVHDYEGHNQCHVQVIPKHRKEHSKEFGLKGMKWIWDNTDMDRMVASIAAIYPNVKKYAEMQGFKVIRTLEKAYEKDGKLSDVWILEVTR